MMNRCGDAKRPLFAAVLAVGGIVLCNQPVLGAPSNLYAYSIAIGDSQTTANAVLFDGQSIWVGIENQSGGALVKMTETGVILSTTPIGTAPIEMAYDGENVWVTNYTSSTLSIVSQNGSLVNTIQLPVNAHPEGILFDGKYIWIANNGAGENNVSKFDAAGMTLIANYPVGNAPDGLAFDGNDIWVTNSYSDNVMKLDRETGEIIRTYPTGEYPLSIIFDGSNMWIGNGDVADQDMPPLSTASLTKLRAYGGVNLGTFAAGNAVRGLAYDGMSIWACNSIDNTFTRVRTSDGAQLGTYPTGNAPRVIAFDGVRMWIANSRENTLTVVSATDATATGARSLFYIPDFGNTPQVLAPVAPNVSATPRGITAIAPRVPPSVAALGGILDALLDN